MVVRRDVAWGSHQLAGLALARLLAAAVEEVCDVGVLFCLGDVELPQARRRENLRVVTVTDPSYTQTLNSALIYVARLLYGYRRA